MEILQLCVFETLALHFSLLCLWVANPPKNFACHQVSLSFSLPFAFTHTFFFPSFPLSLHGAPEDPAAGRGCAHVALLSAGPRLCRGLGRGSGSRWKRKRKRSRMKWKRNLWFPLGTFPFPPWPILFYLLLLLLAAVSLSLGRCAVFFSSFLSSLSRCLPLDSMSGALRLKWKWFNKCNDFWFTCMSLLQPLLRCTVVDAQKVMSIRLVFRDFEMIRFNFIVIVQHTVQINSNMQIYYMYIYVYIYVSLI